MPPLSSSATSRSIIDSVIGQIGILFCEGVTVKGDTNIILHGSATEPERWGMAQGSDIDLIIVHAGLERWSLDSISERLSRVSAGDYSVRSDMRVGPIAPATLADKPAVLLQVQVISDLNYLSPVSRQIIDLHSRLLVGNPLVPFDSAAIAAEELRMFLMRDLRAVRAMAIEGQAPYWQWSVCGPLVREFHFMPAETGAQREKLHRYAARLLCGWAAILMLRGGDGAPIGPDDLLALAGATSDPNAFTALWAATPGLDEEAGE